MARITLRQLLDHAAEHGYGVPAFNINNMEQALAILEAARDEVGELAGRLEGELIHPRHRSLADGSSSQPDPARCQPGQQRTPLEGSRLASSAKPRLAPQV